MFLNKFFLYDEILKIAESRNCNYQGTLKYYVFLESRVFEFN